MVAEQEDQLLHSVTNEHSHHHLFHFVLEQSVCICNRCAAGGGGGGSVISLVKTQERFSSPSSSSISFTSQLCSTSGSVSGSKASARASGAAGFRFGCISSFHGGFKVSARASSSSSSEEDRSGGQSIRVNSSKNGAANAISNSNGAAATDLDTRIDEATRKEFAHEGEAEQRQGTTTISDEDDLSQLTGAPSCAMPNSAMTRNTVTLFNPLSWLPDSVRSLIESFVWNTWILTIIESFSVSR